MKNHFKSGAHPLITLTQSIWNMPSIFKSHFAASPPHHMYPLNALAIFFSNLTCGSPTKRSSKHFLIIQKPIANNHNFLFYSPKQ